jgi:hypothetical protein
MTHRVGVIWGRTARRLRGLERQLRIAHKGNRAYTWGLPVAALLLCFTILVVAGVLSGASALEFLPIAVFEGLVIAGLFVACMMPATPPPDDRGDRGPDQDPTPKPPPSDPSVWVRLLADAKLPSGPVGDAEERSRRELTGAAR